MALKRDPNKYTAEMVFNKSHTAVS